ncbi:MAG: hypothetical protein J6M17_01530 [Ruminococcus sp.]|nr:hypothetical protein [Ruminococcus sp.]
MLSFLLTLLIVSSVAYSVHSGDTLLLTSAITDSAKEAINLYLSLSAAMALWGGILKVAEAGSVTHAVTLLLKRPVKILFGNLHNTNLENTIAMNITANMLGLGNAALPLSIKAMKMLAAEKRTTRRSYAFFLLLNTASIQLLPTTIAAIRGSHGASDPWDCLPATLAASACALAVGLITALIISPDRKE